MIDLTHQKPLITGGTQRIFQHPQRLDQLIKIARTDQRRRSVRRYAVRRYGPLRGWQREISEIIAQMARTGQLCDRLTAIHGFVDTTEGAGLCTEKVASPDGSLAPTMLDLMRNPDTPVAILQAVRADVDVLFGTLAEHRIDFADVRPSNVAVATDPLKLRVVDGLGSAALIPITRFSDWAFYRQNRQGHQKLAHMVDAAIAERTP